MIDIETLSTKPSAAIIEVGAVTFDEHGLTGEYYSKCYPDLTTSTVDLKTLKWWMDPPHNIPLDLHAPSVAQVLDELAEFLPKEPTYLWANSPSFDMVILTHAYEQLGLEAPWDFRFFRDVRTLHYACHLAGLHAERPVPTQKHNALSDCHAQAVWVMNMLRMLGE